MKIAAAARRTTNFVGAIVLSYSTALAQTWPAPSPTASPSKSVSPGSSPVPGSTPLPMPSISPVPTFGPLQLGSPSPLPTLPPLPKISPLPTLSPEQAETPKGGPNTAPIPDPFPSPTVPPGTFGVPSLTPFATPTPQGSPLPTPEAFAPPGTSLNPTDPQFLEPYVPNLGALPSVTPSADKMPITQVKVPKPLPEDKPNPKAPKLTIDEAIATALRQNPGVLNAIQQVRVTHGQYVEVRAQAIPQIGVTSAYNQQQPSLANPEGPAAAAGAATLPVFGNNGQQIGVVPIPGGATQGGGFVQDKTWNIQFQGSQLIFNGQVFSNIKGAALTYDSSYYSLRQTIDDVIEQVTNQFYQVVLNRALIVAQEESVALLQSQVTDQLNRFEAGTVPRFNVLQAEVQLANAIPGLVQARNDLRISQYQLVRTLGVNYPRTNLSEVPFNVMGTLDYVPRKVNIDESIKLAIKRNPALKAQRQQILIQVTNVSAAYSGYLPEVSGSGGYTIENNVFYQNLGELVEGWFFGIQGSWSVFDGLATAGQVQQARAQLQQAKNNYDNAVRELILQVQEAISNLQEAQETVDSQIANVAQAAEALRLARERLDAGAGTQLDVLNAQVQLLQSQTTELQARYDYIAAVAAYDRALSIETQYAEVFDDPLTRGERKKYDKLNNPQNPVPRLPRAMRDSDPLDTEFGKPSPTPKGKKRVVKKVPQE